MGAKVETAGNTIAELIALGMEVTAFCRTCNRYKFLDLAALQETRGRDMPIRRVALRLRCDSCGARDCDVLLRKATDEGRWN